MKASEIIAKLNELIAQYGDLETFCEGDEALNPVTDVRKFESLIDLNDAFSTEIQSFFVIS